MALTPQQLQALYQSISAGQQSAFSGATPGMGQDERNGWINSYGNSGTNYGDYLNWYANQNGTSGQVGSPTGQGSTFLSSIANPTGQSYTPGGSFAGAPGAGGGGGAGSFVAGAAPKAGGPPTTPLPGPGDTRPINPQTLPGSQGGQGLGTPGFQQYYTPGSGNGAGNPYAQGPAGMTTTPGQGTGPTPGGGITPPSTGITPTPLARPKSNYSFVSGGWSQPNPWGSAKWG